MCHPAQIWKKAKVSTAICRQQTPTIYIMHLALAIVPQVPSAGFQNMVGSCSAAAWQLMYQQMAASSVLNRW